MSASTPAAAATAVARVTRLVSSERTGDRAAGFAVAALFGAAVLVRVAVFGFVRRAAAARARFAVPGFLRLAPLGFLGEAFRFTRRGARAGFRLARTPVLRFAATAFLRLFFFATRFVVFRIIA